ncbi:MAG: GntR family transcriptional regulator [Kocuria rhizophila]|uniref:GntR family transcriptional regulator n=1 Tax=Kocuria carniphila TaxID=262208 RepID=UPI000DB0AB4D|nr:GntR family transcriptional regulator [Kocuria carniphila]MCT1803456.1 GntR family transcriptional regulator [Kocuria carniphila]PZP28991.1 MAG: GntR family transcriptional regulator [Kocuria rhizophila]
MIEISQGSSLPIYVQLINGVLDEIRNGELTAGDKIMSIRSLASQLEIAPNTVARAYADLEKLGVIVSRGRKGSFVTSDARATADSVSNEALSFVESLSNVPDATRTAVLAQIVRLLGG